MQNWYLKSKAYKLKRTCPSNNVLAVLEIPQLSICTEPSARSRDSTSTTILPFWWVISTVRLRGATSADCWCNCVFLTVLLRDICDGRVPGTETADAVATAPVSCRVGCILPILMEITATSASTSRPKSFEALGWLSMKAIFGVPFVKAACFRSVARPSIIAAWRLMLSISSRGKDKGFLTISGVKDTGRLSASTRTNGLPASMNVAWTERFDIGR